MSMYPTTATTKAPPKPAPPQPKKVETKKLTEAEAATKIQSAFRGMQGRKEVLAVKSITEVEGEILATCSKVSVWKICGEAKELLGEGELHLVKTRSKGAVITYMWFQHDNALPSGVFPCPVTSEVPVMRHASNYLVFPTIEFSVALIFKAFCMTLVFCSVACLLVLLFVLKMQPIKSL
eukprot:m.14597 g.14597  ORF g.14597 m.14597 type:complete len:179 (+) comp5158_c0_seq2:139-675(+)